MTAVDPVRVESEAPARSRARVEGDREQEILGATLEVLAEVGFDRLTMDAVATAAKASKATLYRRWQGKTDLVVDALVHHKGPTPPAADTGTLRGDLLALYCGVAGFLGPQQVRLHASLVTALHHDPEFAAAFRARVLAPKVAAGRAVFERARERGEISDEVDLDLLTPVLPGVVLHRVLVLGDPPSPQLVEQVLDQVILPAATRRA